MIITQTPLRLSFLGGNTDFPDYFLNYGGLVLSTTIDKYIYCIVKERFDDYIIVNYSKKETVNNVEELEHELVREALKLLEIEKGIEISFLADIPTQGTGLGSSSAVTIGVLNALHTFKGESVPAKQLAEEAVEIELEILGKPIGVQDQHAIAMGGLRAIEFTQGGDVYGQRVEMDESTKQDFNNSLMLLYTGKTRQASDILKKFDVNKNKPMLDQNKVLADRGIVSLLTGNLRGFGELLDEYWQIKRVLSEGITDPDIDEMYRKAKDAGAIGGKIIGAGGGGFLLLLIPSNRRAKIRKSLSEYQELPFRFSDWGSRVIFNV